MLWKWKFCGDLVFLMFPNLLMDTYFLSFKPCCVDRDAIISGNFKFTSLEDEGTAECWYRMQRGIGMLIHTTSCLHQDAYILPKNHTNLNNASKILSHLFFFAYWEGLSYSCNVWEQCRGSIWLSFSKASTTGMFSKVIWIVEWFSMWVSIGIPCNC